MAAIKVEPRTVAAAVMSLLLLVTTSSNAFVETPKFSQLRLLYPGYPEYGGQYSHDRLLRHIFFDPSSSSSSYSSSSSASSGSSSSAADASKETEVGRVRTAHHSAAVRLSWTLNRYGGRHAIGFDPVRLSSLTSGGRSAVSDAADSFAGSDGQQYIFRNEAFGPFLAARYGNPEVVRTLASDSASSVLNSDRESISPWPMSAFVGRQGIVRVVSHRRRSERGHVALWDCDHFYQSRDWSTGDSVVAVEFWESADSNCPDEISFINTIQSPPPDAHVVQIDQLADRLVPRHNFRSPEYLLDPGDDGVSGQQGNRRQANEKPAVNGRHGRTFDDTDVERLWLQ